MALRKLKPTTPGQRGASVPDFAEITRTTPEKSLVRPIHSKGGRNNQGRITVRHQGGGHKRAYRLIDFVRNDKDGIPAKVAHIEYDLDCYGHPLSGLDVPMTFLELCV